MFSQTVKKETSMTMDTTLTRSTQAELVVEWEAWTPMTSSACSWAAAWVVWEEEEVVSLVMVVVVEETQASPLGLDEHTSATPKFTCYNKIKINLKVRKNAFIS